MFAKCGTQSTRSPRTRTRRTSISAAVLAAAVAVLSFVSLPLIPTRGLAAAGAGAAPAPVPLSEGFVPGEILVKFRSGVPASDEAAITAAVSATLVDRELVLGFVRLRLPEGASVPEAVLTLSSDPRVAWAEPNWLYYPSDCPDCPHDPYLRDLAGDADQWGVFRTGTYSLWRAGGGGSDTLKIAIIDTGIDDFAHPHYDLAPNVFFVGRDFVQNDDDPTDAGTAALYGHGTHVAGIAAAAANPYGIAGVAYCSILTLPASLTLLWGGFVAIVTTNLPPGWLPSAVTAWALPVSPAAIS